MARTKAKTTVKRPAKFKATASLPEGYKTVGRAPAWDFEKHPVISGIRGETHEVVFNKGDKKKEQKRRTIIVEDTNLGPVTVWESTMLAPFFDNTDDGDDVYIRFDGYGKAKKGMNAPKLFTTAVKQ